MKDMFPTVHSVIRRRFSVVVATGSAGGIESFLSLVAELPSSFPVPIILAQHLNADYPSRLVDVLQRRTALQVCWAEDSQQLTPRTVFVGRPGHHVLVSGQMLVTVPMRQRVLNGRPSGDLLLSSAALSCGSSTLGMILSGCLSDGASGAQLIRRFGGVVIAQDPASTVFPDMPRASIQAGIVNFVLRPAVISAALVTLVMQPGAAEYFCGACGKQALNN